MMFAGIPSDAFNATPQSINEVLERLEWAKTTSYKPYHCFHDLKDGRCVKHGSPNLLEEARVMAYIRQNTSIPVPRLLMAFEQDHRGYLVMDFVDAESLDVACCDLTSEQLSSIALQLADFVQQIRRLPLPRQPLGSWNGGPYRNTWFTPNYWEDASVIVPASPFRSVDEFHAYWLARSGLTKPLLYPESYSTVLTHGDLDLRNILVRGGRVAAIIDWDTFGWYPDFWEPMVMHRGAISGYRWRAALNNAIGNSSPVAHLYHLLFDTILKSEPR